MGVADPDALYDLLERIQSGHLPDRQLDQDLFCDLGLAQVAADGTLMAYYAPPFTEDASSLAAYVSEFCPGAHLTLWPAEVGAAVEMTFPDAPQRTYWGAAPTPPRAFVACLLEALIAVHEERGT